MREFNELGEIDTRKKKEMPVIEDDGRDPEKKQDKILLYSILCIVGIIVIFFIFYSINKPEIKTLDEIIKETLEGKETEDNFLYNGFVFVRYMNLWYTQWQEGDKLYSTYFHFSPREVENVPIEGNTTFRVSPLTFISLDPLTENKSAASLAVSELGLSMVKVFNIEPVTACSRNITDACADRPIINCNTSVINTVFYFEENGTPEIEIIDNCMILRGEDISLLKSVDRLLYKWYNIMP